MVERESINNTYLPTPIFFLPKKLILQNKSHAHSRSMKKQNRYRTSYTWSEDENSYFVHLYRIHECLWNTRKSSYANKTLQKAAFAAIATQMLQNKNIDGLGIEVVNDQMSYLRATYHQQRKKINPHEGAQKWYNDMDFIVKNSGLNNSNDSTDSVSNTK